MKVRKVLLCLVAAVALAAAVFGCTKVQTQKAESVDTTAQASEKIVVNIVIDGSKGEDKAVNAEGQMKISSGATAYDALKNFCDANGYEITGDPSYVKTIDGLGEGSFGAAPCGWMVSIDGEYPSQAVNNIILKDGNEIIWEFVK